MDNWGTNDGTDVYTADLEKQVYAGLREYKGSMTEVARKVGVTVNHVRNVLKGTAEDDRIVLAGSEWLLSKKQDEAEIARRAAENMRRVAELG
jgi:predicted transcriptional regulator